MRCLLITSGSYLGSSLSTEFGSIPPAFLPVGNDCVFELIAGDYGNYCDRLFMSVPVDYSIDKGTQDLITKWKITLIYTSPHDTIARGIGSALKSALQHLPDLGRDAEFVIVHGDTYVPTMAFNLSARDFYAVGTPSVFHNWGVVGHELDGSLKISKASNTDLTSRVLVGVFGISNVALFLNVLDRSPSWDWLAALSSYGNDARVSLLEVSQWMDFSFDASYYESRRKVNAAREFNELWSEDEFLVKKSKDKFKMRCESSWFSSLPSELSIYAPVVGGFTEDDESASYRIEYLSLPSLAHIFVFGRLKGFAWRNIFNSADRLLTQLSLHSSSSDEIDREALFDTLIRQKTIDRLAAYCSKSGVDLDTKFHLNGVVYKSPRDFLHTLLQNIGPTAKNDVGIVHGDFCASNILYNFSAHRLKVIDPRGYSLAGVVSNYGDRRYEVAKLSHSIIGLYDFIIGGRFRLEHTVSGTDARYSFQIYGHEEVKETQEVFKLHSFGGYSPIGPEINEIMATLFLSMLPLHSDDPRRQLALLCNAYRVIDEWRPEVARHLPNTSRGGVELQTKEGFPAI
jgi:hypothetical protein